VCFDDDDEIDRAVKISQPLHALTEIMNNCNGLVYIQKERDEIGIWNPFIIKYKKLPIEPIQIPFGFIRHTHPKLAFGYDPVNDDYEVVRVVKFYKNQRISVFEVKVYNMRVHYWRRVEDEWPYKNSCINNYTRPGTSFNGAMHWLVTTVTAKVSRP
jgi:F-box interacting protein